MTADNQTNSDACRDRNSRSTAAAAAPVYGLGFIGAVIYYIQFADSFWLGVLGFFKAMVWPAFLVYDLLKFLNM